MYAQRLDGKQEADRILKRLVARVRRARRPITLATILVGSRYDSALYVKLKRQAAARAGINTEYHHLPQSTSQASLARLIRSLNRRTAIHGILLQLPLPQHLDADAAIAVMDPNKDVDGFHPANRRVVPPPIGAVMRLITLARPKPGRFAVVLAQPSVFAQQLVAAIERAGHTAVTLDPYSQPAAISRTADILVTAVGRGQQITARDIAPGAILIDVGIRKHGKKTVGDVATACWKKAGAISPVPGGVGPLTIACVLDNTVQLAQRQ